MRGGGKRGGGKEPVGKLWVSAVKRRSRSMVAFWMMEGLAGSGEYKTSTSFPRMVLELSQKERTLLSGLALRVLMTSSRRVWGCSSPSITIFPLRRWLERKVGK